MVFFLFTLPLFGQWVSVVKEVKEVKKLSQMI